MAALPAAQHVDRLSVIGPDVTEETAEQDIETSAGQGELYSPGSDGHRAQGA